jgi:hypothetical protein
LKSILSFILLSALAVSATTISGKVTNGTSNKPAAGDQVILIKLSQTMEQETTSKVGADGRYSLEVSDNSVPHLVRVIHDKVMYHQPAPPGTTNADVTVYDALPKLAGVTGNMDVMRMQTDQTGLAVTEMYVLKNTSSPPRTLMSDHSFEIYMPENAALDAAMAAGPGGMPVRSAPAPLADKGHYAFIFPLRPGETRFQVSYHLPYSGSANFAPRVTLPFENVAVELPQSMQFTAADAGSFDKVVDEKGATVQVAKNVAAGKAPAFRISGSGTIPEDALSDGGGDGRSDGNSAAPANRPGGGIGTPENTPDPLQNYRWYVLGGIALVLAAGVFWMTNRRPLATATGAVAVAAPGSSMVASRPLASTPAPSRNGMLLEALKEELFQLETERLQNKISAEEYEKAKAALDQTLARAMRRSNS